MKRLRWELFVALRYLRARRKQTMMSVVAAVSVIGVTVGVMALVIALGLMSGFQHDVKAKILGSNAHILIFPWGSSHLRDYDEVVEKTRQVQGVLGAAPVIYQQVMAVNEKTGSESPVLIKGIDVGKESTVTDIATSVTAGNISELIDPPAPGPAPIVLGDELAKQLAVLPGDTIRVVSLHIVSGPGGMSTAHPANRRFRVTGIFHSGMWDYDSEWAYVNLALAQEFFRLEGSVSLVEARLSHPDLAEEATKAIEKTLGDGYRVESWQQMNKAFFSALNIEKLLLFLVISLIGVVAALNIAAMLVMNVMEKGSDIGILMAMGARRASVQRIFRYQGLAIGIVGTLLGLGLGTLACFLLDRYRLVSLSPEVYYISYIPFRIEPFDFSLVAISALLVSFLATIYPSRHASRLSPCEALRYE